MRSKLLLTITFCFALSVLFADEVESVSVNLPKVGDLYLVLNSSNDREITQLLLKRKGQTTRQVIDTYQGMLPDAILKHDLNSDGNTDIIVITKHPDNNAKQPYIYSYIKDFTRIFPENANEINPFLCSEIFITSSKKGIPAIGMSNQISYHDFGPPHLFRTELYALNKGKLELIEQGLTEGNHYNILMNKGAIALHAGQYIDAIDYYNKSITSSTGEITTKAFIESIFNLAEARKFTKDFKTALDLYEKIVLEFSENPFTDIAQKEIELISSNIDNLEALSFYIDVISLINTDKWNEALDLLNNHPIANSDNKLLDRFLFTKAEIFTAINKIEEAVKVYNEIKEKFPESPIIESVNELLEDIATQPDDNSYL
ncbi:MAG: tetratricopeptide repeat protein [Candidatus Riflebacteria bacterium]|nr:tetratricopeptide repeat protein [Candidatus Riflebacteria bacterium]